MQQLPLFNRLKSESEIGDSLLNFQGRRRLNTKENPKIYPPISILSGLGFAFIMTLTCIHTTGSMVTDWS